MGRVFYHAGSGVKATRAAARADSLKAKLESLKETSIVLNGSYGFENHRRSTTNLRANQSRARRQRKMGARVEREQQETAAAGSAVRASLSGSGGWQQLTQQNLGAAREAAEEAARQAAKEALQAEKGEIAASEDEDEQPSEDDSVNGGGKSSRASSSAALYENTEEDRLWEEYLRSGGGDTAVKAVLSAPDYTPGWSSHPYRPGLGPVGGMRAAHSTSAVDRVAQPCRSYSRVRFPPALMPF